MIKRRLAIFTLVLTLSANALLFCSCGGKGKENATHGTETPREEMTENNGTMNGSGGLVDDITDGVGDMADGVADGIGDITGGMTNNGENGNEGNTNARRGGRMTTPLGR